MFNRKCLIIFFSDIEFEQFFLSVRSKLDSNKFLFVRPFEIEFEHRRFCPFVQSAFFSELRTKKVFKKKILPIDDSVQHIDRVYLFPWIDFSVWIRLASPSWNNVVCVSLCALHFHLRYARTCTHSRNNNNNISTSYP